MRGLRGRRCVCRRVLARYRCRMRRGGCGFWVVWRGGVLRTRSRWRFGCAGSWTVRRWRERWGTLLSGTRACARSSLSVGVYRGRRFCRPHRLGVCCRYRRGGGGGFLVRGRGRGGVGLVFFGGGGCRRRWLWLWG